MTSHVVCWGDCFVSSGVSRSCCMCWWCLLLVNCLNQMFPWPWLGLWNVLASSLRECRDICFLFSSVNFWVTCFPLLVGTDTSQDEVSMNHSFYHLHISPLLLEHSSIAFAIMLLFFFLSLLSPLLTRLGLVTHFPSVVSTIPGMWWPLSACWVNEWKHGGMRDRLMGWELVRRMEWADMKPRVRGLVQTGRKFGRLSIHTPFSFVFL